MLAPILQRQEDCGLIGIFLGLPTLHNNFQRNVFFPLARGISPVPSVGRRSTEIRDIVQKNKYTIVLLIMCSHYRSIKVLNEIITLEWRWVRTMDRVESLAGMIDKWKKESIYCIRDIGKSGGPPHSLISDINHLLADSSLWCLIFIWTVFYYQHMPPVFHFVSQISLTLQTLTGAH